MEPATSTTLSRPLSLPRAYLVEIDVVVEHEPRVRCVVVRRAARAVAVVVLHAPRAAAIGAEQVARDGAVVGREARPARARRVREARRGLARAPEPPQHEAAVEVRGRVVVVVVVGGGVAAADGWRAPREEVVEPRERASRCDVRM